MKIKILFLLLILLLLVSGGYFAYKKNLLPFLKQDSSQGALSDDAVDRLTYVQNNFDSSRMPDLLPKDLPWEKDVEVIQNFNAVSKDNTRTSSVREYVTNRSVSEVFDSYKKYMTSKDYKIIGDIQDANSAVVSGRLDDVVLTIEISDNKISKQKTVSVSAYKEVAK